MRMLSLCCLAGLLLAAGWEASHRRPPEPDAGRLPVSGAPKRFVSVRLHDEDTTPVNQSDMMALRHFFDAAGGTGWHWKTASETVTEVQWNFTNYTDASTGVVVFLDNPCIAPYWQGVQCVLADLGTEYRVSALSLPQYNLRGSIPPSVSMLDLLESLVLDANFLTQSIPDTLNLLTNLVTVQLGANELTGPLPALLPASLTDFSVFENRLSGRLPEGLGSLNSLVYLAVDFNSLSGSVPESLCTLPAISRLLLRSNCLTGTIPSSVGNMSALTYILLDANSLNGTIPSSFASISGLVDINIFRNKITGAIPSSLGDNRALKYLYLDTNALTSSLPADLCRLSELQVFTFNSNKLNGVIPECVGSMAKLVYFMAYRNSLAGTIPASLGEISYLSIIDIEANCFSGALPSSLFSLPELTYLNVSNCRLSGRLSASSPRVELRYFTTLDLSDNALTGPLKQSFFASMPALYIIFLQHNLLTGPIRGVFDAGVLGRLNNLDLSDNRFTGELPSAELFASSELLTFAASTNCLRGELSKDICKAVNLTSLILDGVGTASTCRNNYFNLPYMNAYWAEYRLEGGIPDCLFSMPNLATLQLGGNGLDGSLTGRPDDAPGPALRRLVLSHNRITGRISKAFTTANWSVFDVSYNRIHGAFEDSDFEVMSTACEKSGCLLSLEVNRYSGFVPSAIRGLQSVSVLAGNMFYCSYFGQSAELPEEDAEAGSYQCGSNSADLSMYLWLLLAMASVIGFAFFRKAMLKRDESQFRREGGESFMLRFMLTMLSPGRIDTKEGSTAALSSSHMTDLVTEEFAFWRNLFLRLTAYVLLLCLPVYLLLSAFFRSYDYKYAWSVSAGFVYGLVPALCCFFLWAILLFYFGSYLVIADGAIPAVPADAADSVQQVSLQSVCAMALRYLPFVTVLLVDVSVMLVVNILYVYLVITFSSAIEIISQISMSFLKLFWNGAVVPALMANITKGAKDQDEGFSFHAIILVINNLVLPCIAIAFVSPNCFYNMIVAAEAVESQYKYMVCIAADYDVRIDTLVCTEYADFWANDSFEPPFTYAYQCSSTLMTKYVPVYMYLIIMVTFGEPMVNLLLIELLRGQWPLWLAQLVAPLGKPFSAILGRVESSGEAIEAVFDEKKAALKLSVMLTIFATFGVVFPPLAAMICLSALTYMAYLQAVLVEVCSMQEGNAEVMLTLGLKIRRVNKLLKRLCRLMTGTMAVVYACFLFDMLGDSVGWRSALWLPCLSISLPVILWLLTSYWRRAAGRLGLNPQTASDASADRRRGEDLGSYKLLPSGPEDSVRPLMTCRNDVF